MRTKYKQYITRSQEKHKTIEETSKYKTMDNTAYTMNRT